MEASDRRTFLRHATLGVAAVGALSAVPRVLDPRPAVAAATPAAELTPAELEGPVVAYLRDAHSGQFSLFVGEREVAYTDKAMAARLTRAAG